MNVKRFICTDSNFLFVYYLETSVFSERMFVILTNIRFIFITKIVSFKIDVHYTRTIVYDIVINHYKIIRNCRKKENISFSIKI